MKKHMKNKQTAVEWFYNEIFKPNMHLSMDDLDTVLDKANAMFEKQIMEAHKAGWLEGNNPLIFKIGSEQHFKDNYGK